ncbi:hypothetical protein NDU88_002587 [Pleurodeles waltl]|uniref:Uncharacterized protein n=1 Tax=Pleurodeles waltl TaxID=8319 RepID=A0AAV7M2X9_PLEWA|nr:hypothetical protein NDU88_002587 [Pleurodeles waltl]
MAPKTIRNLGDKSEGAKTTRIGRDKGETVGLNKRLASVTGGVQDSSSVHITPSPESDVSGKEPTPLCISDKKLCIGNKDLCAKFTQYVENPSEIKHSSSETREKVFGLPRNGQPQIQQVVQSEQLVYQSKGATVSTSGPTAEKDDPSNLLGSPKKWDKSMGGKNSQLMDWGKDSSDKFYSLTEESDLSSANRSFSESDESETSETGNKSPSCEFTVRQF